MPTLANDPSNPVSNQFWALHWYKAQIIKGCVTDSKGDVLIVGGDVRGPSSKGGECVWPIEIGHRSISISEVSITIHTNGGNS